MNTNIKLWKVGGCVRDELLGIRSKDIDYAVEAPSWSAMKDYIEKRGKIHTETPQYYTIRGFIEGLGNVDFVLCRKDGEYTDGRRPDTVEPGSLLDDLKRRDFTMNAIAVGEDGVIVDPFGGQEHIKHRLITCVGKAEDRLSEDALRMLRALRFSITKDFRIGPDIERCLSSNDYVELLSSISIERIRDELLKCFEHNVTKTIQLLYHVYPAIGIKIFGDRRLWLKPTIRPE